MKKVITVLSFILFASVSFCQNNQSGNHSLLNINCKTCHNCEVPKKEAPCLKTCPRDNLITINRSPEKGPEVVVLNKLEDRYVPVIFSHKIHAQMSEMSGGCEVCHHYNTLGPILPCSYCHKTDRKTSAIDRPDLKGALHRQCMNCHRQWSHSIDCQSCHVEKKPEMDIAWQAQIGSLRGKSHPKVETPGKIVYKTNYDKGRLVTFYHNEHTEIFKLDCISCHKNENCIKCHDVRKTTVSEAMALDVPVTADEKLDLKHKVCNSCHQNDDCNICHSDKPKGPFNHAVNAGWNLNRFHIDLECSKCHGTSVEFKKLDNQCTSCHKNFSSGKFNHDITGVKLSEIHKKVRCKYCHIDRKFGETPSCINCHVDESFPKNVPGKLLDNYEN